MLSINELKEMYLKRLDRMCKDFDESVYNSNRYNELEYNIQFLKGLIDDIDELIV